MEEILCFWSCPRSLFSTGIVNRETVIRLLKGGVDRCWTVRSTEYPCRGILGISARDVLNYRDSVDRSLSVV